MGSMFKTPFGRCWKKSQRVELYFDQEMACLLCKREFCLKSFGLKKISLVGLGALLLFGSKLTLNHIDT